MAVATKQPQPIKALLALRGIRQDQLAQAVGVSETWLSRCVLGYSMPSDDLRARLAEYLDVKTDLFVDDPDDVVVAFVKRTTSSSGVPERVVDEASTGRIAGVLRGAS